MTEIHNHSRCPDGSNEKEWTDNQATGGNGNCYQCGKNTTLRFEPFSQQDCCKNCWESIVYGDEND